MDLRHRVRRRLCHACQQSSFQDHGGPSFPRRGAAILLPALGGRGQMPPGATALRWVRGAMPDTEATGMPSPAQEVTAFVLHTTALSAAAPGGIQLSRYVAHVRRARRAGSRPPAGERRGAGVPGGPSGGPSSERRFGGLRPRRPRRPSRPAARESPLNLRTVITVWTSTLSSETAPVRSVHIGDGCYDRQESSSALTPGFWFSSTDSLIRASALIHFSSSLRLVGREIGTFD